MPDLDASLKSKNPQVKEGTLKFLRRSFASASTPIQPSAIKPLAETLVVLLEDSSEGARNEAASCFGYLMKMVGERPLNAIMDNVADIRKAKITEAFEKATVKCKTGGGAPTSRAAPTAASKKAVAKPLKQDKSSLPEEVSASSKPSVASKTVAKPAVCNFIYNFELTHIPCTAKKNRSCGSEKSTHSDYCTKNFWQGRYSSYFRKPRFS